MSDAHRRSEEGTRNMVASDTGQNRVYAVNPDTVSKGIEWYLNPVIADLEKITASYAAAHDEVKAAHDTEAAGWFGGTASDDVKMASSSFLNETEWQLRQLRDDQTELTKSLTDYRNMLAEHLTYVQNIDQKIAANFRAIDQQLDEMGH
jgi:hypothetical protein